MAPDLYNQEGIWVTTNDIEGPYCTTEYSYSQADADRTWHAWQRIPEFGDFRQYKMGEVEQRQFERDCGLIPYEREF